MFIQKRNCVLHTVQTNDVSYCTVTPLSFLTQMRLCLTWTQIPELMHSSLQTRGCVNMPQTVFAEQTDHLQFNPKQL